MAQLKKILAEKNFTASMHGVITAMQELSVTEMQRIRDDVLETRTSMAGLLDIFLDIQFSQEKAVKKELETKRPEPKVALVLLTQNHRFSDSNINEVWTSFLQSMNEYPKAHIIVIGKVGEELLAGMRSQARSVEHFTLADSVKSMSELQEILTKLREFDQVLVQHGQFDNLLHQTSNLKDISGKSTLLDAEETAERKKRSFFFEPDIAALLNYFEQEVQGLILQQTVAESRLAHVGSRVQTLEAARGRMEESLKKLKLKSALAKRRQETKKQQQRLSGISLWG